MYIFICEIENGIETSNRLQSFVNISSTSEVAAQFSVSETSLKNYFRGVFGQNISIYLREVRMKKAAELLATTRLSVAEVAEQVGYMNQSKFASVFKKQFGLSPLEYRRSKNLEN